MPLMVDVVAVRVVGLQRDNREADLAVGKCVFGRSNQLNFVLI